jgi:hypothetical protein
MEFLTATNKNFIYIFFSGTTTAPYNAHEEYHMLIKQEGGWNQSQSEHCCGENSLVGRWTEALDWHTV